MAAVVGIKDRYTNTIVARPVDKVNSATVKGFIYDNVDQWATVYIDEAKVYKGLHYEHESVNHSLGEYVRGPVHTQGI